MSQSNFDGKPWGTAESNLLRKLRSQGVSYAEMTERVNATFKNKRTQSAVSNRLHALNGSAPAKKKTKKSKNEVHLERELSMLPLAGYRKCEISIPGFSVKMEAVGDKVTQVAFGRLVKAVTATVK